MDYKRIKAIKKCCEDPLLIRSHEGVKKAISDLCDSILHKSSDEELDTRLQYQVNKQGTIAYVRESELIKACGTGFKKLIRLIKSKP